VNVDKFETLPSNITGMQTMASTSLKDGNEIRFMQADKRKMHCNVGQVQIQGKDIRPIRIRGV
jgi:hypothetical protein